MEPQLLSDFEDGLDGWYAGGTSIALQRTSSKSAVGDYSLHTTGGTGGSPDRTNAYLDVGPYNWFDTEPVEFGMWVRDDAQFGGYSRMTFQSGNVDLVEITFNGSGSNAIYWDGNDDGTEYYDESDIGYDANEWNWMLVRATDSFSSFRLYFDGQEVSHTMQATDDDLDTIHLFTRDAYNDAWWDDLWVASEYTMSQQVPPTNLSVSSTTGSVDLSWTENHAGNHKIYHKTGGSGGRDRANYTEIATVSAGTTTYTHSTDTSTQNYYVVETIDGDGRATAPSNEVVTTPSPSEPSSVDATYVSDDQIDLSWASGTYADSYDVEIERDGGGWTTPAGSSGPSNTSSTSASYAPDSDQPYGSVVGIDSSFRFRVRSRNSVGTSGWVVSDTVYTSPVPPEDVYITRSDANSIQIHGTIASDIADYIRVQYREDTGSGYGAWLWFDNEFPTKTKGNSFALTNYQVGTAYQSGRVLQEDARYQFRIRTQVNDGNAGDRVSDWVYASTGNNGNVFFTDDFESGDASAWSSTNFTDTTSGVTGTLADRYDDRTPHEGSYALQLVNNDYVQYDLGDLSGESDVVIKCMASDASLDGAGEYNFIEWYDGTSWSTLEEHGWEYNKQGWYEWHVLVPDSLLSTDNRFRLRSHGGGPVDFAAFDRVEVADLLHEYTKPAAPTLNGVSTPAENTLQADWTNNTTAFGYASFIEVRHKTTGGAEALDKLGIEDETTTTRTFTPDEGFNSTVPNRDGEQYDIRVDAVIRQRRDGVSDDYWRAASGTQTATTPLPAPTDLSEVYHTADSVAYSYQTHHDYGDVVAQYKRSSSGSWVTDATLPLEYGYRLGLSEQLIVPVGQAASDALASGEYSVMFSIKPLDKRDGINNWPDVFTFNANSWRIEDNNPATGGSPDPDQLKLYVDDQTSGGATQKMVGAMSVTADVALNGGYVVDATATDGTVLSYKDGVEVSSSAHPGTDNQNVTGATELTINGDKNYSAVVGRLDLYDRALSPNDVQTWHNGNHDAVQNGRVFSLALDEGQGGTPTDSAGGGTATTNEGAYQEAIVPSHHVTSGLLNGEEYNIRVLANTEHTQTEDN